MLLHSNVDSGHFLCLIDKNIHLLKQNDGIIFCILNSIQIVKWLKLVILCVMLAHTSLLDSSGLPGTVVPKKNKTNICYM